MHGEHGGYGMSEPSDAFLARDDVAAALDGHPSADFIREHLGQHPELIRMMSEPGNDYLTRSLLDNPKTIESLLKHPDAIPILADAVHEVDTRGYQVVDDVRQEGVEPFDPTPEQAQIVDEVSQVVDSVTPDLVRQGGFDGPRTEAYCRQWLAEERANWPENQRTLNELAERAAGPDGDVKGRLEPKEDDRAMAKIRKYQYDGAQLTDLVGARIQFERVADLYRTLDQLRQDPGVTIVEFSDRIADPKPSGYRDLQMSVRLENGHVAELRLHLKYIDDVADYEHSLYEVRRDFDTLREKEGREVLSPEEVALDAAIVEQVRGRFEEALRRGLTPEENG